MSHEKHYLVLGCKSWNRAVFDQLSAGSQREWKFIADPQELSVETVRQFEPRYLFFLHWSWKVPAEIVESYECVCFHMTDVPYGRGGSPLQNLITRGHKETMLTALRMTMEMDAGPVYLKKALSLQGSAEEIYIRAGWLSEEMVRKIVENEPVPSPQTGEPVLFKRRRPEQSEIMRFSSLDQLYDHIRMLDAEGYPRAFLVHENFRYEFRHATLCDGRVVAEVTITPCGKEPN